jgi:hypothetical protein
VRRLWVWQAFCTAAAVLILSGGCNPEKLPVPVTPVDQEATALPTPMLTTAPENATGATGPSTAVTRTFEVISIPTPEPQQTEEVPGMNEVKVPAPFDMAVQQLVDQARADLAKRLSVDAGQIETVDVYEVTWPNSGLGCPKPGMVYTQVMIDGIRIRLRAGGRLYEYHSGGQHGPFLCEQSSR